MSGHRIAVLFITMTIATVGANFSAACGQTTWFVDDDNCPGPGTGTVVDPFCLIQDAIDAAVGGDIVEVAPGTYFENLNLLGKAITLRSSGGPVTTIVDGSDLGSVITCGSGEGRSTVIEGFTVFNGQAIAGGGFLISGASPTIRECVIEANLVQFNFGFASGGAAFVSNGAPEFTDCSFVNNSAFGNLFNGGGLGGGMYVVNASPVLINCDFTLCFSNHTGGAIYVHTTDPSGAPMELSGCTFTDNSSSGRGGAIYGGAGTIIDLSNCDFVSNDADRGGAVDLTGGSFSAATCEFNENESATFGGAVYLEASSALITGSTFSLNQATHGGALYTTMCDDVEIDQSTFSGNATTLSTGQGGALFCLTATNLCISDCLFELNTTLSTGEGGAIFLQDCDATCTINSCTFDQNHTRCGGGIHCFGSEPLVSNCHFTGNTASFDGGGFYSRTSNTAVLSACTFENNTAVFGGGALICSSDSSFADCEFLNNSATGPAGGNQGGGGLYLWQGSNVDAARCRFQGNSAASRGGGIFTHASVATIRDSKIEMNDSIMDGGGAYAHFSSTLDLFNCLIVSNSTTGTGSQGGALSASATSSVIVGNCTLALNTADSGVGGVLADSATLDIENSILYGNAAPQILDAGGSTIDVTFSIVDGGFAGAGNQNADPLFVVGPLGDFYLSQVAAGQGADSPAMNAGQISALAAGLSSRTTRTDQETDAGFVDLGYHYDLVLCPADINGDSTVDIVDLLALLAAWGPCPAPCPPTCAADVNDDCTVDVQDLLALLAAWGACS